MNFYIFSAFQSSFSTQLINSVSSGINWAIKVSIYATAISLAISLIAWLIHRS